MELIERCIMTDAIKMADCQIVTRECPWIAPCPTCGAVCVVTVTSNQSLFANPPLKIEVDYKCKRKHYAQTPEVHNE